MLQPVRRPWTVEEFLTWERAREERCELVDQMIRFLPDERLAHAMITGNLLVPIMGYLRADPAGAHALVVSHSTKVVAGGWVLYPDVVASCARQDPKSDIITDPLLIAEVVSKRSAAFDRGGKRRAYQSIASLADFCLVSQDEALVEHYSRNPATGTSGSSRAWMPNWRCPASAFACRFATFIPAAPSRSNPKPKPPASPAAPSRCGRGDRAN